ncbi:MAG: hypothetical protein M3680_02855 [Myxococcota bacterium]|nr:hypothetical protein [Myxococcota bacterium]
MFKAKPTPLDGRTDVVAVADLERLAGAAPGTGLAGVVAKILDLTSVRHDLERIAMDERVAARAREDADLEAAARAELTARLTADVEREPWVLARLGQPGQGRPQTRFESRHRRGTFLIDVRNGPKQVTMRQRDLDQRLGFDDELRLAIADGAVVVEPVPTAEAIRLAQDAARYA